MPNPASGTIVINNSGDSWSEGATITLNDGDGGTLVITASDLGTSPYATTLWTGGFPDVGDTVEVTDGELTITFEAVATNGGTPSGEGNVGVWRAANSELALANLRTAINNSDLKVTATGTFLSITLTRDVAGVINPVAILNPAHRGWAYNSSSITHYSGREVFRIAGRTTSQIAADIAGIVNANSIKISAEASDDTVILTNDENGSQGNQTILTDSVGDDASVSGMSGGFIMANIKPIYFETATGGFKSLSGSDNLDLPAGVNFGGTVLAKSGSNIQWGGVNLATANDIVTGLKIKDAVIALANANIDLSSGVADVSTQDGVALSENDRVLLIGQTNTYENGIYVVGATPANATTWTRAADMDADADFPLAFVFVEDGTTYADTGWVCTNNSGTVTLGVTAIGFSQFSSAGSYSAGDGLDLTGSTFSVDVSDFAGSGLEDDGSEKLRIAASAAGYGLSGGAGSALALDGSELTGAILASGDSIVFTDATDSSAVRVESVDDFSAFLAGAGLSATAGVLAVNVDDSTVEINADALRVKALGIDTAHIANDAITSDKIAADAVTASEILDGVVGTGKITDQAVTSAKISDGAVGEMQLADAGVSADKLAEGALQPGNANVDHLCFQLNGGESVLNAIYRPLFVDDSDPSDEVMLLDDMSVADAVAGFVGLCGDASVSDGSAVNILRVNGIKIAPGTNAIGDNSGDTFLNIGSPVYLMDGGLLTTTDADIASGDYYLQVGIAVSSTEMITEFGRAPMLKP